MRLNEKSHQVSIQLSWPLGFTPGLHAQLATAFVFQEKKMPEHWCTYSAESKSQFLINHLAAQNQWCANPNSDVMQICFESHFA